MVSRTAREQCLADGSVHGVSIRCESHVAGRLVALSSILLATRAVAMPMASAAVTARAGFLMPFEFTCHALGIAFGSGAGSSILELALRLELLLRIDEQRAAVRPIQFKITLDFTSLH
eukprot:3439703-Pleurochrysis_carterae.AAC.2